MTTYRPFYPSSLVNESQGGAPWTISGGGTSATVSGEGVTDFLKATGFGAAVPLVATVVEARLLALPDINQSGYNNSDPYVVGTLGKQQAYVAPPFVRAEADSTSGLTPAAVNDVSFGFKFSIYAMGGGLVAISSVALYIDVE